MIFRQEGARAHAVDTFDWRKWAYDKAAGKDMIADAIVIVEPHVRNTHGTRPPDGYSQVAALIVEGLAAGGVVRRDRHIAALIVKYPVSCGHDGMKVSVVPAHRLERLLGEPAPLGRVRYGTLQERSVPRSA